MISPIGQPQQLPALMSVELSDDIGVAAATSDAFKTMRKIIEAERCQLEDDLKVKFGMNLDAWKATAEGKRVEALCSQEDVFSNVIHALDDFIRVRTCRTAGDLLEKLRREADTFAHPEDYADWHSAMLLSLVPWLKDAGAGEREMRSAGNG